MYNKLSPGLKKAYDTIRSFITKAKEDSLSAYAAQTTFFIILSFVPLIIILFLIASKIPFLWNNILNYILGVIPEQFEKYVYYIVDDIMFSGNYSFTIVTVLLALWSSAKTMQALSYGLDKIYGVKREKNYFITRLISMIYVFVFLLMCLAAMVIDIFGSQIVDAIIGNIKILSKTTVLILSFRTIFVFAILFLFLLLIYYRLPARKGKLKEEVYGAAAAAGGLILMTRILSFYIKHISNMSYMYGGLTSIIVMIIWLYIAMQIVLYGAQLNYYLNRS